MSCVGDKHPWFQDLSAQLEKEYGVGVRMEAVASQSLSYADLSWLLRIGGVEVLIIDAEGHDCRILQSMIDHCAVYPGAWPDAIQFETMGLNDMQGSYNTEEHILDLLNKHGYVLACKGVCGRRRRSRRRTAPSPEADAASSAESSGSAPLARRCLRFPAGQRRRVEQARVRGGVVGQQRGQRRRWGVEQRGRVF